jgi:holo-ACP synthase/triphosphoribosyl-dephospho-CoA synthase
MISEVSLTQILAARDKRAAVQRGLLQEHGLPLLCFTMNIAGPIKRSHLIDMAFMYGESMIAAQGWPLRGCVRTWEPTGCEAVYAIDLPAAALKAAAVRMEEHAPVARLFDMDVLDENGQKLCRGAERACIVCGGGVAACARSRAHGLAQLQRQTDALLCGFAKDALASAACRALLREVHATPKPGLVDEANNGAHADMDIAAFERSAKALEPYFAAMAGAGLAGGQYDAVMGELRAIGKAAELAMLQATGGVNTHKGLIYSLGLLVGGMGYALRSDGGYREHARRLACVGLEEELTRARQAPQTHGEHIYAQSGVTGLRGEAAAGFPAAFAALSCRCEAFGALPDYEKDLCTLLHCMASLEDTNLLHRGGEAALRFVQAEASRICALPAAQRLDAAKALDEELIRRNLSPGGSADTLAACIFLEICEGMLPSSLHDSEAICGTA